MRKRQGKRVQEEDESGPPAKKPRKESEIAAQISLLRQEMQKSKPKSKVIRKLLDETETERRTWISENGPCICDVIIRYPPLKHQRWVSIARPSFRRCSKGG